MVQGCYSGSGEGQGYWGGGGGQDCLGDDGGRDCWGAACWRVCVDVENLRPSGDAGHSCLEDAGWQTNYACVLHAPRGTQPLDTL